MKDRHKTNYEKKTKPVFKDTSLLVGDLARSFPLEVSRLRSSFAGQHSCTRGAATSPLDSFFAFASYLPHLRPWGDALQERKTRCALPVLKSWFHFLESSFCKHLHYPVTHHFNLWFEICLALRVLFSYPYGFRIIVSTQFHNTIFFRLQNSLININFIVLLKRCLNTVPGVWPVKWRQPEAQGCVSPSNGKTESVSTQNRPVDLVWPA